MAVKIDKKIVSAEVVREAPVTTEPPKEMKAYARPYALEGFTYKIRPPTMSSALYITINDLVLPDGRLRPFEVFLNSKDVSHSQWMIAVTRLLSSIFRQPLPFEFVIDELWQTHDPKGAYFIPGGGGACGGVVAHIAKVIEEHCLSRGMLIRKAEIPDEVKQELDAKKEDAKKKGIKALACPKCQQETYLLMDGCYTCTSCGESKCG